MYGQQEMPQESSMPGDGKAHHSFKAQHHSRLAKLHHGIGKAHEMAAAHHEKMMGGGEQEPDGDEGMDSDTMPNKTMPMSFGRSG